MPDALRYIYQYPFMPKGLMGRLIVRLHTKIESQHQRKVVWQLGMVLKHADDDCRALAREKEDPDTGGKIIEIIVNGRIPENRRHLLREIRSELQVIHQRSFPRLRFTEKVPCCCPKCRTAENPCFFDLSDLLRAKQENVPDCWCAEAFRMVSIQDLLAGVFPDEVQEVIEKTEPEARQGPPQAFLSYSRHNQSYLNELKTALGVMRRKGEIALWDDSLILPGEEWDNKIKESLRQSDLILLLVSDHALDTDYIWDIEIKEAMARHEKGECTVIPIVLEPSDWEETDFSKLLALPAKGKPVSQWPKGRKDAWQAVVKGIRRVLKERSSPR